MKVTVIGIGYIGLATGACLDVDPAKIKILNDGGIPIHESGLLDVRRGRPPGIHPRRRALGLAHGTSSSSPWAPRRMKTARPT